MALPANFGLVTVKGTYVGLDGQPISGSVTFTPTIGSLIDAGAVVTVVTKPLTVILDGSGSFTTQLPATDDPDLVPTGWTYTVQENFPGGRTYSIQVPVATPVGGLDITLLTPVPTSGGSGAVMVDLTQFETKTTTDSIYITVVEHGANAATARPAGAIRVFWRGTVAPGNAVQYDRWINTSAFPYTESIFNGSTWAVIGSGNYVQRVNGKAPVTSAGLVTLTAADVSAIAAALAGVPGGVATLDANGLLAAAQRYLNDPLGLGLIYSVDPATATNLVSVASANRAIAIRCIGGGSISKLRIEVGASSGNIDLGIYRNLGTGLGSIPATKIVSLGSTPCPAANAATDLVLPGGPFTINPGDWLVLAADNVTATFRSAIAATGDSALYAGRSGYMNAAFPLPAALSIGAAAMRSPVIVGVP